MAILKKKGFWISIFIVALVAGGIAYYSKSRIEVSFASVGNTDAATEDIVSRKVVFANGAETPFREGRRLINEKKLDEALTAFQQAAKLSPDTAVIHYWIGMTYFYKKESEKAIAQFMKTVALEPENYRANAMIGRSLLSDRSKIDQAADYFMKALSINPEYLDARFELARIFAFKGDMKRSMAEFAIIFRTESKYAMYHYELGRILESRKAVDQAKNEYQRALMLNPKFSWASEALEKLKSP
jgi:tetratricopeptide (TPR) repeat protein